MIIEKTNKHQTKSRRDDIIVISPFQGLVMLLINMLGYNYDSLSGFNKILREPCSS